MEAAFVGVVKTSKECVFASGGGAHSVEMMMHYSDNLKAAVGLLPKLLSSSTGDDNVFASAATTKAANLRMSSFAKFLVTVATVASLASSSVHGEFERKAISLFFSPSQQNRRRPLRESFPLNPCAKRN